MQRLMFTCVSLLAVLVVFAAVTHGNGETVKADVPVALHTISVPEALVANGDLVVIGKDGKFGPFTTCSRGMLLLTVRSAIDGEVEPTTLMIRTITEAKDAWCEVELFEGPLTSVGSPVFGIKELSTGSKQRLFKGKDYQTILLEFCQGPDSLPYAEQPVSIEAWWKLKDSVITKYATPSADTGAIKVNLGTAEIDAPTINLSKTRYGVSSEGDLIVSLNHGLRFADSPDLRVGDYGDDWVITHQVDQQGRLVISGKNKEHDYGDDFYLLRINITGAKIAGLSKLPVGSEVKVTFRLSDDEILTDAQTIARIVGSEPAKASEPSGG